MTTKNRTPHTLWICGSCGSARVYYTTEVSYNVEDDIREVPNEETICHVCHSLTTAIPVVYEVAA